MPSTQLAALTHDITAPARQILATLPKKQATHKAIFGAVTGRCSSITPNHAQVPKSAQSKRTYYLGANGRVSQRKHLVGVVVATVRAFTTDHARFLFTEAGVSIGPKPFIGEAEGQKADRLVRKHSAFVSFMDLATNTHPTYRPSLDVRDPECLWLADYYDRTMEAHGDPRRAFRYGKAV